MSTINSRLDSRKRHANKYGEVGGLGFFPGGVTAPSFAGSPDPASFQENKKALSTQRNNIISSRQGHSISSSGGGGAVAGEPMPAFPMRGRPGSASDSTKLPALRYPRASFREQDVPNHPLGDRWNAEVVAEQALPDSYSYNSNARRAPSSDEVEGSWNSDMRHRRTHSAPNILEGMTPRWRGANPALLPSGERGTLLRDHVIPEGRRFEALEPPLQPGISSAPTPRRPRSWQARTAAPLWGVGSSTSVKDSVSRDPSELESGPKLKASYFVHVRGQEGEVAAAVKTSSIGSLLPRSSAIGGMTADTRPFEEIKRMRLSQALNIAPNDSTMLGLTAPSPTYSASGMGNHFDTARLTPRFPPGNGLNMSGFKSSTLQCRSASSHPAYGVGGMQDSGFGWQPLSPALTEPPTPPSHPDWKAPEPETFYSKNVADAGAHAHLQARAVESEQGVLPMEQRPLDEVKAVQALMSVGRGTRAEDDATTIPQEPSEDAPCFAADAVHGCEKLPDGGDDDDDGLDKDLWVVVEKGSVCTSSNCVYRDQAARIAARRHYHSKCNHTHNGGSKKGMVFHHHQLEKVQKHQRSHKREATKSAPYKRTTPEDYLAMEKADVEGYRPDDWDHEETRQLDELVNQHVAPVTHAWPSIARYFPTKSSIQCLLHWRFTLNNNGIIRGNGTWGAEEDARLRKLAPVFSSPATGPRWAKIAEVMPGRTAKQCRERFLNHVDPGIKKDKIWTAEEDALVMQLHAEHHNQFAKIARCIPGRCYDDVKNRFNLLVKRRQLVSKSANSGSSTARPTAERPVAVERQMLPQHHGATSGVGLSPLIPRGGVKRSTPGFSGEGGRVL